jgi:hypothetical protein
MNETRDFPVDITVDQARKLLDEDLPDDLLTAIDEAQALVFSGEESATTVTITIKKNPA